jgi:cytoplasmic iron level regulating protein YaaA (DUF328/UPF0246 family)
MENRKLTMEEFRKLKMLSEEIIASSATNAKRNRKAMEQCIYRFAGSVYSNIPELMTRVAVAAEQARKDRNKFHVYKTALIVLENNAVDHEE